MKKGSIIRSALCLMLAAVLCLSMAACGRTQTPADGRYNFRIFCAVIRCTAREGFAAQTGGGKPLHGKERREYSPRRVQHRLHG